MRLGKAAFGRAIDDAYRQGAAAAVDLGSTVFGTADCAEGLSTFVDKRMPQWGNARRRGQSHNVQLQVKPAANEDL